MHDCLLRQLKDFKFYFLQITHVVALAYTRDEFTLIKGGIHSNIMTKQNLKPNPLYSWRVCD